MTHLSFLGFILVVLRKQVRENVSAAASDVHKWTFLAKAEPSRHGEHHAYRLYNESPLAKIATYNEPTQYSLDLQHVQ